eukprot:gene18430-22557_t
MSRICELTGKGRMVGNNVSHANNKTRRRFLPNLNDVTLISDVLGQSFKLRVSAAALRTVDHRGGLDAFLAKAKDDELSVNALKIKREIAKVHGGDFRLTANQNLVVADIAPEKRVEIEALLTKYGMAKSHEKSALRLSSIACVALPTCGLALAEAERYLPDVITDLED